MREPEEREPAQRAPAEPEQATGLARLFWLGLGCTCVALGALGVLLPGLPTTPFLILAAASFARSSRALYERLMAHRIFGPLLRDYREHGTIPPRVKWLALGTMSVFVTFALVWGIPPQRVWVKLVVLCGGLFGLYYVARLPTRPGMS